MVALPPIARWRLLALVFVAGLGLRTTVVAAPLIVGIEDYKPYSYLDESGQPAGFVVDLISAVAQEEHLEIRFELEPWDRLLADFKAGHIDILANVGYSKARTAFIDYSVVHSSLPAAIFVRKGLGDVSSLEQLRGRRFAQNRDALFYQYLEQKSWTEHLLATDSSTEALQDVDQGTADATITNKLVAAQYIRAHRLANIELTRIEIPALDYRAHFGVHRGATELLYQLNEGLMALRTNGTYDRVYEKWLGPLEPRTVRWRDLLPYLASFGAILATALAALVWQRRLALKLVRQARALEASEARYRALIDGMKDIVFSVAVDGRIQFIGPQVRRYGFKVEDMLGRNFLAFVFEQDRAALQADFQRTLSAGEGSESAFRVLNPAGETVWMEQNSHRKLDQSGQTVAVFGILRDIDERKRAEAERDDLQSQLIQAQKMDAVGQLAGGVAHDFNNFLTAILMHLSLLQGEENVPPSLHTGLADLEQAVDRAKSLTRQLLLFARRQAPQTQLLDLDSLLSAHLKMLRRVIGAPIELEFRGGTAGAHVNADPGMIEQVVMNLVVNARDAMPNGGRIDLATDRVALLDGELPAHPDARPGCFVRLSLTDTGTGMSEATLKRLFEPFFTTKEVGKGTGLGLATVYGIVKRHEGWILVDSALGRGTTFHVFLPEAKSETAATPSEPARSGPSGGTETILVVEDEPVVQSLIVVALQRDGYTVLVAKTAPEAIGLWTQHSATVDLLLTDMVMPGGMTGLQLARTLRESRPHLPVILISGYNVDWASSGSSRDANLSYLPKPFSVHDLKSKVRQSLDGHPSSAE